MQGLEVPYIMYFVLSCLELCVNAQWATIDSDDVVKRRVDIDA